MAPPSPRPVVITPLCAELEASEAGRHRRLSWSKLLARVFSVDVLRCDRCGSRMQRVEWCLRRSRIDEVLQARGPPTAVADVAGAA